MRRVRAGDRLGHALAGTLGPVAVRSLARTLRLAYAGEDGVARARGRGPVLYVLWHGRLLPFVAAHQKRDIVGLVSEHRDGEYIARILAPLGYGVVRGSTTRGGARALWEMALRAAEGRDLAITLDGPHGPAMAVRPGALALASRAAIPIVPVGVGAEGFFLPSWDRFLIPRPGGRVAVVYGRPLAPPGGVGGAIAAAVSEIALRLDEATAAADRRLSGDGSRREDAVPLPSRSGEI